MEAVKLLGAIGEIRSILHCDPRAHGSRIAIRIDRGRHAVSIGGRRAIPKSIVRSQCDQGCASHPNGPAAPPWPRSRWSGFGHKSSPSARWKQRHQSGATRGMFDAHKFGSEGPANVDAGGALPSARGTRACPMAPVQGSRSSGPDAEATLSGIPLSSWPGATKGNPSSLSFSRQERDGRCPRRSIGDAIMASSLIQLGGGPDRSRAMACRVARSTDAVSLRTIARRCPVISDPCEEPPRAGGSALRRPTETHLVRGPRMAVVLRRWRAMVRRGDLAVRLRARLETEAVAPEGHTLSHICLVLCRPRDRRRS